MANDKKKVKEVATCIRTLLKVEGTDVKIKDVAELIKDEDLSNPVVLKDKIKNDMRAKVADEANQPNRRDNLRGFIIKHHDILKENPDALDALQKSYCQGRINKEQRAKMLADLMAACENQDEEKVNTEENSSGYDF